MDPLLDGLIAAPPATMAAAAPQRRAAQVDPLLDGLIDQAPPSAITATAQPQPGLFSGSIGSQIGDLVDAAGHHLMNLPHGLAQGVEHLIAAVADKIDPTQPNLSSLVTDRPARAAWNQSIQDMVASDDAALAQREADYQKRTDNTAGAYAGATLGEVAPFLAEAPVKLLRAGGDLVGNLATKGASSLVPDWVAKLAGKGASGATQGGMVAAASPVTSGDDYWGSKGTQLRTGVAIGGTIPIAVKIGSALASGVKDAAAPILNPQGVVADWAQRQATAAGVDPQALAAQLRNAPEYVPGSQPTTAQAAPLPFLVQAEKTVTNNPELKGAFADRQAQNNLARIQQLNTIAGQPGTLDQLTEARAAQAREAYQAAYANGPSPDLVTPEVEQAWTALQQRPAIKQAFAQARQDLANENISLPEGNSPYDQHVVQLADYAKKALDSRIDSLISSGSSEGLSGLRSARDALVDAVDQISPEYQAAREGYAAASPPINSMQAGTQIINGLSGRAVTTATPGQLTGAPLIRLDSFRAQLAQALKKADYGVEPDKLDALRAIQDDLQRETASGAIRSAGSDTAYNLQAPGALSRAIYGNNFTGGGNAAKVVGGAVGAAGGWLTGGGFGAAGGATAGAAAVGKLASIGNKRVMEQLGDALANPSKMADLLEKASNGPPTTTNALILRIGQAMRNGAIASSAGAPGAPLPAVAPSAVLAR